VGDVLAVGGLAIWRVHAFTVPMALDVQRILIILERALVEDAPMASLQALTELRWDLDLAERAHVARALQDGQTFTSIAEPLAISRQTAHRRYRDLTSAPPPPQGPTLSREAHATLVCARAEEPRLRPDAPLLVPGPTALARVSGAAP
jgi:hypothetical protein